MNRIANIILAIVLLIPLAAGLCYLIYRFIGMWAVIVFLVIEIGGGICAYFGIKNAPIIDEFPEDIENKQPE